jgi:hypothetical protein
MQREYKGRIFLEISLGELSIDAPLRTDVYLYLPLNGRMIRVLQAGDLISSAAVEKYRASGHSSLFILNSTKNVEEKNALFDPPEKINPEVRVDEPMALGQIKQELPMGDQAHVTHNGEKTKIAVLVEGHGSSNSEDSELSTEPAAELAVAGKVVATSAEKDNELAAKTTDSIEEEGPISGEQIDDVSATSVIPADANADQENSLADVADPLVEQRVGPAIELSSEDRVSFQKGKAQQDERGFEPEKDSDEEVSFSSEGEKENKQSFRSEKEKVDKLRFDSTDEEESDQVFDPDQAEEEAMRLVKGGGDSPVDNSSKKFATEISDLEEELGSISADGKEFVEEARKISGGDEKAVRQWKSSLEDDSPKLHGMTKEDKAATKLAHSIGNRLGLLRRELSGTSRNEFQGEKDARSVAERTEELKDKIKKLEATASILESLDEKEGEVSDSAPELKGKKKAELLSQLESELSLIGGTELLSKEDQRLMEKKVKQIRSRDLGMYGEEVERLRESIAAPSEELKKKLVSPEERTSFNAKMAKEVKAALTAAKITKALAGKRDELKALLDAKARSKQERKNNEKRAEALQEEIRRLDSLVSAVESGEPLEANDERRFAEAVDARFALSTSEDPEQGMARIHKELERIKESVVDAKVMAAEAQESLLARINESSSSDSSLTEKQTIDSGRIIPQQIANLSDLQDQLIERKEFESVVGGKFGEEAKSDFQQSIEEKVTRAGTVIKMEQKLTQMRQALTKLVLAKKDDDPKKEGAKQEEALLLLKKIQGLESVRDQIDQGKPIDTAKLGSLVADLNEDYSPRPGDSPLETINRMTQAIGTLKDDALKSNESAELASKEMLMAINASDLTVLKEKTVNTKRLDAAKGAVSRFMQKYLETGKDIDPQELWEIRKLLAGEVRQAEANLNISAKISSLAADLLLLQGQEPKGEKGHAEWAAKKDQIAHEILRLKGINDRINVGEFLPETVIAPFTSELPEEFKVMGDKPTKEQFTKVLDSLDRMKEQLLVVKKEAIKAIADLHLAPDGGLGSLNEPNKIFNAVEAEEEFRRMVSAASSRMGQAGVYAATIFRSFGYRNFSFDRDIMLASYLWSIPVEEVRASFSENVADLHASAHNKISVEDMMLSELGQAVNLGCRFLEQPGVVTGKFSLDPDLFEQFCDNLQKEKDHSFDSQLLARARQSSLRPLPAEERQSLVQLAKEANRTIDKWKQAKVQARVNS